MEQIQSFTGDSVPVVSLDNSARCEQGVSDGVDGNSNNINKAGAKLIGVVYESSIVKGYMDTVEEVRRDEHGID